MPQTPSGGLSRLGCSVDRSADHGRQICCLAAFDTRHRPKVSTISLPSDVSQLSVSPHETLTELLYIRGHYPDGGDGKSNLGHDRS
jgi:hypothetical protein